MAKWFRSGDKDSRLNSRCSQPLTSNQKIDQCQDMRQAGWVL